MRPTHQRLQSSEEIRISLGPELSELPELPVPGSLGAWLCGSLVAWLHVSLAAWLLGYQVPGGPKNMGLATEQFEGRVAVREGFGGPPFAQS